ncbi:hypothetical protein GCM10027091_69920 [Streptomyces daliensis]
MVLATLRAPGRLFRSPFVRDRHLCARSAPERGKLKREQLIYDLFAGSRGRITPVALGLKGNDGFSMITGLDGDCWTRAADAVSVELNRERAAAVITVIGPGPEYEDPYGGPGPAAGDRRGGSSARRPLQLVRPHNHIAVRHPGADPGARKPLPLHRGRSSAPRPERRESAVDRQDIVRQERKAVTPWASRCFRAGGRRAAAEERGCCPGFP